MKTQNQVVLVTTTFYRSLDETRFSLALEMTMRAQLHGYPLIIVDGSPVSMIAEELTAYGAIVYRQQTKGIGPSRREAYFYALEYCKTHSDCRVVQWLEPEKHGMLRFIKVITAPIISGEADVVIATRSAASRETYPVFQQETEAYANKVYMEATGLNVPDVMVGPVAFSIQAVGKYLVLMNPADYGVEDTYIQGYAPILAHRDGLRVIASPELDFQYPPMQRVEEESTLSEEMMQKRIWQRDALCDAFRKLGALNSERR
ncbi:MAG: hypothetical protein HY617_00990 [Candidatus Sungbacteria bacterium]|nr:hypothetical protein [Candidatus Sungbacteria bacterium]